MFLTSHDRIIKAGYDQPEQDHNNTHRGGVHGRIQDFWKGEFVCMKFFASLNENIEMALDITNNVIIVGGYECRPLKP